MDNFSPLALIDLGQEEAGEEIFSLSSSSLLAPGAVRSTCIDPLSISFLRQLNVEGSVNVTRSFEGHPRVTLSFIACSQTLKDTRLNLLNGSTINLLGLPLRIISFSIDSLDAKNVQSRVSIQLQGIHAPFADPSRNPLDRPVRLRNCFKPQAERSLSALAIEVGAAYLGKDLKIRIPRNTGRDATTTTRGEFTKRVRVNNDFAYYSNPLGIQAKPWKQTPLHVLDPEKVLKIESHNFNGAGALVDCVQLAKEFRNAELKLDTLSVSSETEGDNDTTVRWEFENAMSFWDCQTPAEPYSVGENIYITKTPGRDILRNPGLAWDVGGFTKTAHRIEERNGVEVRRVTRKYGYIFSSLDTYLVAKKGSYRNAVEKGEEYEIAFVPRRFVTSYWREVESTTTTRYHDGNGYLIKIETRGKRLARLKQDSSNLDGIRMVFGAKEELFAAEERLAEIQGLDGAEEEIAKLEAIIEKNNALLILAESFKFDRTLPVTKITTYSLDSLRSYFPDIQKPDSEGKCIDGSTWIEPKFAKHVLTVERTRVIEDNPGSTADYPLPPIETGKIFTEEQRVKITSTKKTEKFVTTRYVSTQQGEGLGQKIRVLGSTEHIARPSIHQRINNNVPSNSTSSSNLFDLNSLQNISINKFLLNTPDSNPQGNLSENSLSFPDVTNLDVALAAAKTQLEIDNARNAEVLTLSTLYQPEYNEGDRILWEEREYVILGISHNIQIAQKKLSTQSYQLTLGRILDIPVELTKVRAVFRSGILAGKNYGLNAIDGNVDYLKNAYNFLSAETIDNAQKLGHLDSLANLFGFGLEGTGDFEGGGGIDDFLGGGGLDGSSGLGGREFLTPIEKGEAYVELLNRLALLQEFKDKFLAHLNGFGFGGGVNGDFGDNIAGGGGGDNLGGAGGSGNNSDDRTSKYYKVEGGKDRGLAELLSQLINLLKDLIKLFRNPSINIGGFGLGSGAGGGAGGSVGGASGGSGEEQEQEEISDDDFLAALLASFGDPDAMFAEIMALIARLIALANSFDPELLINFLNGLGLGGGSGDGSSGGSGTGSGTGSGAGTGTGTGTGEEGEETVEEVLIQLPDYLGFNDLDFATLFNRLDELLRILDLNANKFNFDLDLDLLTDYSQGAPVGGSSSVGGGNSFNNGLSGSSSGINSGLSSGAGSSLGGGGLSSSSSGGLSSGGGGQGGSTIIGSNINNPSNPGEYGYSDGGQGGSGSGFGDSEASPGTEIYDPLVKLQMPEVEADYAGGLIPSTIDSGILNFPDSVIQADYSGGLMAIPVTEFYTDLPEWFNKVEANRSNAGAAELGLIIYGNITSSSLVLQSDYAEAGISGVGTIIYNSLSGGALVFSADYAESGTTEPGTIIYTNLTSANTLIQTESSSTGIPSNAIAVYPPT